MAFVQDFKDILSDSGLSADDKFDKLVKNKLIYVPESGNRLRGVVIKEAIYQYFENFYPSKPYDFDKISTGVVDAVNKVLELENALNNHDRYKKIQALEAPELSVVISELYYFKNVKRDRRASNDMTDLMYWSEDGWYKSAPEFIESLCRALNYAVTRKDIQEVVSAVTFLAGEPVEEERNPNWVFLKNGIFEKKHFKDTGELIPYSKDIIAVNPLPIEFNANAVNSVIDFDGVKFDVDEFLLDIANGSDDIFTLLWNVLSAAVYHNRNYKKAIFLYSPIGNNGKGTFLTLCRNLIGPSLCLDIPIESFSDKNLVVNLSNARLVTGDENMVDAYVDNVTNFKNAVTGDPITVDRKYKNAITFSFSGLILQCVNGLPTSKDKTNSFFRRILPVPFDNCFTGRENPDIKDVYLADDRVLEYVLFKALMLDVRELKDVDATDTLLNEYREDNDTLLQWWNDEGSQVDYVWDRIPWVLLYGSYVWWCKYNTARREVFVGYRKFTKEFKLKILPTISDCFYLTKSEKFSVNSSWEEPEPLIGKYDIQELKNPNYVGRDWMKIGSNGGQFKMQYRGICKVLDEGGEEDE